MELAILAGVAMAGYGLAASAKTPNAVGQSDCGIQPMSENENALFDANFQASMHPQQTGIIPPEKQWAFDRQNKELTCQQLMGEPGRGPFFRSEKTMASSDADKQQRLELFTGQLDACTSKTGTFRSKRESGPMFPMSMSAGKVTSSGRQAWPDLRGAQEEQVYQVGHKHDGVGPVNPIQVGPGLGLDPSVPAAGGFQQFYRVCPQNVDGYRKNSLPGRIVPGHAPVGAGATIGAQRDQAKKPIWDLLTRPLQATRAAISGASQYGQYEENSKPELAEGYAGHAYHHKAQSAVNDPTVFRGRTDNRFCGSILNARGCTQGGYDGQKMGDPGTFRRQLDPLPTGPVRSWNQGGFHFTRTQARPTQREATMPSGNIGQQGGAPARGQNMRPTGRGTLHPKYLQSGTAGTNVDAPALTFDNGIDVNKPDLTCGYMPNAASANMWNPQMNNMRLKQPPNAARFEQGGLASVNYARPGTNVSCMNKLPVNNCLDLNLAKDILSSNPLVHPVF